MIEHRLRALTASQLQVDPDRIAAASSFEADLGADSLTAVMLSVAVEEEFRIALDDDEALAAVGAHGTFGKLLDLVVAKLAAREIA